MKREIVCGKCAEQWQKRKYVTRPAEEHIKVVHGFAENDYLCDTCNAEINKNVQCAAVSLWIDHGGIPYSPWEEDYIEIVIPVSAEK